MLHSPIHLPVIDQSQAASRPAFSLPVGSNGSHRFHAMIKPSGSACNLNCPYCFYLHKEQLLDQPKQPRMEDDILEEHIRQYIEAQNGQEVVFSWQGGEPTLMGLDFFRKVVALQHRHRKPGQRIENDLQTNGLLLDDQWVAFLHEHKFLVGLSIDGPQSLHDMYRVTKGGQPTFERVMATARRLTRRGVAFNALCVVNRHNARQPLAVYRFLRSVGAELIQFTPCVEPVDFKRKAPAKRDASLAPVIGSRAAKPGHEESVVTEWSVDPDDWGNFLCSVWNEWFRNDIGRVYVNLFESTVSQACGLHSHMCTHAEICGKAVAIEHNGDVYSCDHFVYPEYRLGNIHQTHEGDLAYSDAQKAFGYAKRDTLPGDCRQCPHLKFCWGECPKNRLIKTAAGEPGLNYLCSGWKLFYSHIRRDLQHIVEQLGMTPMA